MPAPRRSLSISSVRSWVTEHCFPETPTGRVGLELEWLTVPRSDPTDRPDASDLRRCLPPERPVSGGGRVTLEPGGQIEVSTAVEPGITSAINALRAGEAAVATCLDQAGIDAFALGSDPLRIPRRVLDSPRYVAMEKYFDQGGTSGRTMMCNTAALQVNLDLGHPSDRTDRWRVASALGPVLAACFANSPVVSGKCSGWSSSRLQAWAGIDPSRTKPVAVDTNPQDAWTNYALDAFVMCIPDTNANLVAECSSLTFGKWVEDGHELGYPTDDDLAFHLTTLFPPVRPKGWIELRMIDSIPAPWWEVAAAVAAVTVDDARVRALAIPILAPAVDRWTEAARDGLSDPIIAEAAVGLFKVALDALDECGVESDVQSGAGEFYERFVKRGRGLGDDSVVRPLIDAMQEAS